MALVKSIRRGVFFDTQYWVRHSKTGGALKPIYFSSAVMSDKSQQINKCALNPFFVCYAEEMRVPSGQIRQKPRSRK